MIPSSKSEVIANNIPEYYQLSDWAKLTNKDYLATDQVVIKDQNQQILIFAQVYIYKLISNYTQLYIPRGPVIYTKNLDKSQVREFWDCMNQISKKHNSVFTLIEPTQDKYKNYNKLFQSWTSITKIERLPHQTQILDLSLSEEDLLKNMHPKMRYNIKLAKRKGVKIKHVPSNDVAFVQYFDEFFNLIKETSQRGEFAIHTKEHYKNLLSYYSPQIKTSLIVAECDKTILAANIILDTDEQRIYLHGASSSTNRHLMAPPLLQWESILEAKKLGKKTYDFWGTSSTKKSWQGISRFKSQFGGQSIDYPESRIMVHKKFIFLIYKAFRRIRGKII